MVDGVHDAHANSDPQLQKWNEIQAQLESILIDMGK